MDYFLTYAGSVSFRELKNAKKKYFFLNLGGVGAKTRFLSKKIWGRILGLAGKNIGSACLIYMGAHVLHLPAAVSDICEWLLAAPALFLH